MIHDFANDEFIDSNFKILAIEYLTKLDSKYSYEEFKKIQPGKLRTLIDNVEDYRPKSQIRAEKRKILRYLYHFIEHPINGHSKKELLILKNENILKLISSKLHKQGFMFKAGTPIVLIFTLPIDLILWVIGLSKNYFFIPIVSLLFLIKRINDQLKAKKENKLW